MRRPRQVSSGCSPRPTSTSRRSEPVSQGCSPMPWPDRGWPPTPSATSVSRWPWWWPRPRPRPRTRPSRCGSTTTRCPPSSGALQAATDEVLLFPEHGSNTAMEIPFGHTGDELFAGCEVVVRQDITNQRVAACPLEPRGVATAWHGGRLVFWSSTQNPHAVKSALAGHYGLEPGDVHVMAPDGRRRVRRQDRGPGGRAAVAVRGQAGGPPRALDREPLGEHGGDAARSRARPTWSRSAAAATAPSRPTA